MALTKKRWITLACGCFVLLIVGFIYAWSIFSEPFKAEFGWDAPTLALTFTFLMWTFSLGGVAGTYVSRKFGLRLTLIFAAIFIVIGFWGALFVTAETPLVLYLTYGFFGGLGVGFTYTNVVGAITPWFPDKAGFASGTALMCYMLSTIVIGAAASALFGAIGWRVTFKVFGVVVPAVLVFGAITVKNPTADQLLELNAYAAELAAKKTNKGKDEADLQPVEVKAPVNLAPSKMLKQPITYVFWGWQFLLISCSLGITSFVAQIAQNSGATIALSVAFVSIYALSCGFARPIVGTFFDKTNTVLTMVLVAVCQAVGAALLVFGIVITNLVVCAAGLIIFAIGGGGVPIVVTSFAAKSFGPKYYATNFSILNLMLVPASYVGPAISGAFMAATGVLQGALLTFSIMSAAAIIFGVLIKGLEKKHAAKLDRMREEEALEAAKAEPAIEAAAE